MAGLKYVRPQRHNSWFNVIPERDFKNLKSSRTPFLDTFVTIEKTASGAYRVLFEGKDPMIVERHYGFICVWYGEDLNSPDWPFPKLFDESFGHEFVISKPRLFKDTNLLDLIENNGDPIHFKTVHHWLEVKLSNHIYTDQVYSLNMKGKVKYAQSADSAIKRFLSNFLPITEYSQILSFHGAGFGAGNIFTEPSLKAHLILAFLPLGENDLQLHVAASIDDNAFPKWIQVLFKLIPFVSLHNLVAWAITKAGKDDTDGDYRIWHTKRSLADPKLLPGEDNIIKIREWMSGFYPKDFKQPEQKLKNDAEKSWGLMAKTTEIKPGKINCFNVDGEELIAIKEDQGGFKVFEAHCPHQGAHLGVGGELKDNCIACPFHKFYFNTDGKYIGSSSKGQAKDTMQLTEVPHKVKNQQIEVFV